MSTMVEAFENWSYDAARKPGDTAVVETEYGYHIMYYSGDTTMSYRDFMIENNLRNADFNEWYTALTEAVSHTMGDTKYLNKDLILSQN